MANLVREYCFDLKGEWDFYLSDMKYDIIPHRIDSSKFNKRMKVPGYWDECLDGDYKGENARNVVPVDFWESDNKQLHKNFTYLQGVGWYKKSFYCSRQNLECLRPRILLNVNEVLYYGFIFINGNYAGKTNGHRTTLTIDITDYCSIDENNSCCKFQEGYPCLSISRWFLRRHNWKYWNQYSKSILCKRSIYKDRMQFKND